MPLTLVKEVALSPGANQISAELERVVGRFSVSVYNHIDNKKLCISNVELSDFNASTDTFSTTITRYREQSPIVHSRL